MILSTKIALGVELDGGAVLSVLFAICLAGGLGGLVTRVEGVRPFGGYGYFPTDGH